VRLPAPGRGHGGRRRAVITRLRDPAANALGIAMPALAAIALTPFLLGRLGDASFGVLSLQTAALFLLGVNDFGVARAVMLEGVGRGGARSAGPRIAVVTRGLHLALLLAAIILSVGSLVAALALGGRASSDVLVSSLITIAAAAVSLPALPLRASLEIDRRFVELNLIRGTASAMVYGAPALAILAAGPSLTACALALLLSRLAMLAAFAQAARVPIGRALGRPLWAFAARLRRSRLSTGHRALVRRGAWLGAAGTAGMALGYSEWLVVGAVAGPVAVASYAVAAELAIKGWLVTGAFTSAEAPRLAAAFDARAQTLPPAASRFLTVAMLAIGAGGLVFAMLGGEWLLRLWLGESYRPDMLPVLQLLTLGIAIAAPAQPNFLLLQIAGRERAAALLLFIWLPLTLLASALAVWAVGPAGAAGVFALRLAADGLVVRRLLARAGVRGGVSAPALAAWTALCVVAWVALGAR
jgi:O-antigen/teichoic acid export membrane protein